MLSETLYSNILQKSKEDHQHTYCLSSQVGFANCTERTGAKMLYCFLSCHKRALATQQLSFFKVCSVPEISEMVRRELQNDNILSRQCQINSSVMTNYFLSFLIQSRSQSHLWCHSSSYCTLGIAGFAKVHSISRLRRQCNILPL